MYNPNLAENIIDWSYEDLSCDSVDRVNGA